MGYCKCFLDMPNARISFIFLNIIYLVLPQRLPGAYFIRDVRSLAV